MVILDSNFFYQLLVSPCIPPFYSCMDDPVPIIWVVVSDAFVCHQSNAVNHQRYITLPRLSRPPWSTSHSVVHRTQLCLDAPSNASPSLYLLLSWFSLSFSLLRRHLLSARMVSHLSPSLPLHPSSLAVVPLLYLLLHPSLALFSMPFLHLSPVHHFPRSISSLGPAAPSSPLNLLLFCDILCFPC